jgi:hypothetical protein
VLKAKLALALVALGVGILAAPLGASGPAPIPETADWVKTDNMTVLGYSPRVVPFVGTGSGAVNSDLAFWGDWAIQGTFVGFRIVDVSKPSRPKEIVNYTDCPGGQGDVVVYGNILVRAWDSGGGAASACGGIPRPAGQEGSHVFDISDPANPVAKAFLNTAPCGSHTITGIPDPANNRLIVYSSPSSANSACLGFHVMQIPLNDPASASVLRLEPSGEPFAGGALVNLVDVLGGGAAGTYAASGSQWHPDATAAGVTGPLAVVNAGPTADFPTALPTEGCGPLVGFPAGAIALVDRGTCPFLLKTQNAEAAGASGVIVVNNAAGTPTQMGGESHSVNIPSAMVSQADGTLIKANLPANATLRRHPDALNVARACHDTGVILGDAMKVACAGGNGVSGWSLDPADGATLTDPVLLYSYNHGVGIGHTAAFTWDGEMIVFGHEPGGGVQARCQATSTELERTLFFLDADTGEDMGHIIHPRPQTATENCTWHNGTVVPLKNKDGKPRYVWISGNYQSGISAVDFSDPMNPFEFAFVDPPPLVHPTNPNGIVAGGDWSSYWYNGRIYQSDIYRGLFIWRLDDDRVGTFVKTPYSNPQTSEFTID